METNNLTPAPNPAGISKFLVIILIVLILSAAGCYVWRTFLATTATTQNTATSQSSTSSSTATKTITATDTSGVNEEVNTLDTAMTQLDDDALADTTVSNANLGL